MCAVVLYIACRLEKKDCPYLLVDFADYLKVSLHTLGQTFLKLSKFLKNYSKMNIPLTDPSFFIHKFCCHRSLNFGIHEKAIAAYSLKLI